MHVEVRTDNQIDNTAELLAAVTAEVESGLARFARQITRVEVHLSDVNGPRGGPDKRCVLEARLASRQPTTVTQDGADVDDAVRGAVGKMERHLDRQLGRLHP
jgi:ribosome-associated translation inhibitor RaiA